MRTAASPYSPAFTLKTVIMPDDIVHLYAQDVRAGGWKVWEEHGYKFVEAKRPKPDQPYDWFFNPEIYVFKKPGGEEHTFSPEAVEIHKRLFDALSWAGPEYKNRRAWKQWGPIHSEIAEWYWTQTPFKKKGRITPGEWAEAIAAKLREIAARPETVKANREGLLRAAQVVEERLPAIAAKGPRVVIPSPPWGPEMAGEEFEEAEELEDEIRMVAATWLEKMANDQAAEAWSTSGDQLESDLEQMGYMSEPWIEAAFDYSVAVNGELVDKEMHPPEGYVLTDRGGEIPVVVEHVAFESLVDVTREEVSKKRQRPIPLELVERVLAREYGSVLEIPVSVSGEADVYAKPKEGEEP